MNRYKQPIIFLIVGGLSALVNMMVFYTSYYVLTCNYIVATTIAYLLAITVHFMGNHFVTFHQPRTILISSLRKYLVMLGFHYFITLATMTFCMSRLHLPPMISIGIAICTTTFSGYVLSKRWVYKFGR